MMKLVKIAILVSLVGCTASAMASEVTITNRSNYPIPIKYQIAYHNPGHPVVLKGTAQAIAYGDSTLRIHFPQDGYKHAGVVILAVKKDLVDQTWHALPESAKQFDLNPGCWMRTDEERPSGNLYFSHYKSTNGKHGRITCSTRAS